MMYIKELHDMSGKIEDIARELDRMASTSCPNTLMEEKIKELNKLAYENCEIAQDALRILGAG